MKRLAALIGLLSCLVQAPSANAESELKVYTLPMGIPLCVKALPSWDFGNAFKHQPLKWWEFGPPVPHGFVAAHQLALAIEVGSCWRADADFTVSLRQSLNPMNLICNFGGPPGGFYWGPYEIELADGRRVWTNFSPLFPAKSAKLGR
jgi:hypothetical protein